MKSTQKAVTIIAVLSLLLGFSLGQNHRQYLKIKDMEAASFAPFDVPEHFHQHHTNCELQNERLHERMEELRVRLEERRSYLESHRHNFEEAYRQEMEENEEQIRFDQDSENGTGVVLRKNGAVIVLRNVREE